MNRIKTPIIILILLFLPSVLFANGTLKIAYPEYYPFFAGNSKGEIKGFFFDIICSATEKMNVETQWRKMPWKRCQVEVKTGASDAMITVPTNKRLFYSVTHKDPFYLKSLRIFTYKNHPRLEEIKKIKCIEDIKRGNFSVITYIGNGWNENNIASSGIKTFETSKVHNVWKMLAARRGDLVIEWPVAAYEGQKKAEVKEGVIETGVSLDVMPFHLLISRKSKTNFSLEKFNIIIRDMKQDGTINKIVSSYY